MRRYVVLVVLVLLLIGGWSAFWRYAAGKAQETLDGWRAREAQSGRIYECGSLSFGGYPFRLEADCQKASAVFRNEASPLEFKTGGILVAAQIYDPALIISEFSGPLSIADPGRPPKFVASWKLGRSSLRGIPTAPERLSMVFDQPVVDRIEGAARQNYLRAEHVEVHGRIAEGSVDNNPVVEAVLRLMQGSAPGLHPAAVQPIDADVTALLRGLKDFSPKPWATRLREIQAANGRIEITQARVKQGETIAVGNGVLALNAGGRLQGELRVTVAGLEPLLKSLGVEQMVQRSPNVNALTGVLNRVAPGLGDVARQQMGSNIGLGINMLGEQTTLEGKPAVILPLRFDNGAMFLGPVPIGVVPALF
jgi:hypothetical protein